MERGCNRTVRAVWWGAPVTTCAWGGRAGLAGTSGGNNMGTTSSRVRDTRAVAGGSGWRPRLRALVALVTVAVAATGLAVAVPPGAAWATSPPVARTSCKASLTGESLTRTGERRQGHCPIPCGHKDVYRRCSRGHVLVPSAQFWEGVDFEVVRLDWSSSTSSQLPPGDSLVLARSQRQERAERSPFARYALADALALTSAEERTFDQVSGRWRDACD